MANLRDIRRRITSVTNTQQITSAMKMISAAKLVRAQHAARAAQPYAESLREMVTTLARGMTGEDHPLFDAHQGGKSVVILYTSDRGLCGGFNNNLNRLLHQAIAGERAVFPEAELVVFGRTGNDFFRRRGTPIARAIVQVKEPERREMLKEVYAEVVERFLAGEVGRVALAYNHFVNPIRQQPRIVPLLPVAPPEEGIRFEPETDRAASAAAAGVNAQNAAAGGQEGDRRETLFEPSRREILDALLPSYLENQGLLAHLNTEAGEHGARMVAMEGATNNASEMIASLTLKYNRARQAAITTELIEIISGAESL
ncbi:MAG: ATP synthase F1 subunit gamma [bacterium]